MPVKKTTIFKRTKSGKRRKCVKVTTPSGVKSKCTTPRKAAAQERLLNAIKHNPNFKPRKKKRKKK